MIKLKIELQEIFLDNYSNGYNMPEFELKEYWAIVAQSFGDSGMENAIVEALDNHCSDWRSSYVKLSDCFDPIYEAFEDAFENESFFSWREYFIDIWDKVLVPKYFPREC